MNERREELCEKREARRERREERGEKISARRERREARGEKRDARKALREDLCEKREARRERREVLCAKRDARRDGRGVLCGSRSTQGFARPCEPLRASQGLATRNRKASQSLAKPRKASKALRWPRKALRFLVKRYSNHHFLRKAIWRAWEPEPGRESACLAGRREARLSLLFLLRTLRLASCKKLL